MACNEWQKSLERYMDAELPPAEATAFDQHLAACSSCTASVLAGLKLKRTVQLAGRAHYPSSEFRQKIRNQISPRKRAGKPWLAVVLASLVVLAIALPTTQFLLARSRTNQLLGEIADLHTTNLASSQPVDVVSTDRHTVKPWFQGKLPFTFNIPELNGSDFRLIGGRVIFIERETAALLLFQHGGHYLSVYVLPDRAPFSSLGDSTREQAAFNVSSWKQSGLRFILITDAESAQATRLASLLKTANESH